MLDKIQVDRYLKQLEIDIIESKDSFCADTLLIKKINKTLKDYNPNEIKQIIVNETGFNFKLIQSKHALFTIEVIYLTCNNQLDKSYIARALTVLAYIFYNSLVNKYLRYCNELVFNKALVKVKATNLYKRHGKQAITKLALAVSEKVQCNMISIIKAILELRHRIAQSLKPIIGKYLQTFRELKTSVTVDYERMIEKVLQTILFYGLIKVSDKCKTYEEELNRLPDVSEDLLRASLEELFNMFGSNPTPQKISANLNKLMYTKELLNYIGLPFNTTTLYCLVQTIYNIVKE